MKISKKWQLFFLFLITLIFDIGTKEIARHFFDRPFNAAHFYPYGGVGIFENFLGGIDFSLGYVQNSGAAFGMLRDFPQVLLALRTILLLIMTYMLFFKKKLEDHQSTSSNFFSKENDISITLILSGAFGNLIDNFRQGYVIDFLNFHFYGYPFPLFNMADSYITIGAVIYLLKELFFMIQQKKLHAK